MMQRRSLLAAIFGAPLAAGVQAPVEPAYGPPVSSIDEVGVSQSSPFQRALFKARDAYTRRMEARDRAEMHMPAHIGTKKSWSPAFKVHVLTQETINTPRLWEMSDVELAAFLASRGFEITGAKS